MVRSKSYCKFWKGNHIMLNDSLQREVVASIKKSLICNDFHHKNEPDISSFIATTSKIPLKNLDEWEQLIRRKITPPFQKNSLKYFEPKSCMADSLTWLNICNADGFKRERALKELSGGAPNSFLLALVVRRLNDWVHQVRNAACDLLPLLAQHSDPEIIVDVLFIMLPHWDSWGRMGNKEKNVLVEVISMDKIAKSLKGRLISATSGPVATIFSQVGRTDTIDKFLPEISGLSVQPFLRAKAYRCQFERKFIWVEAGAWQWIKAYGARRRIPILNEREIFTAKPFLETLRKAISDRSPKVRRIAGEMLIKESNNIGEEAFKLATILASDTSPSVAERGNYALANLKKRS